MYAKGQAVIVYEMFTLTSKSGRHLGYYGFKSYIEESDHRSTVCFDKKSSLLNFILL